MTFRRGLALALLIATASCRVKYGPADEPVRESKAPQEEPKTEPQTVPQETAAKESFSNRRLLEFAIDEAKTAGRKGVELWYSVDAVNWINHGFYEASVRSARFLAPRDARYEVVLVPVDKADQREYTPRRGTKGEFTVVVDTAAPSVEVLAPNGGELLRAGHTTVIRWAAEDASLATGSIRLEISDDGRTWIPIARDLANTGTFHWDIPMTSSRSYKIRAVATDLAGNTGMDASDESFTVDGLPPGARILGPSVSIERPVKIEYAAEDVGGAGIKKVALYVSRDGGQTWTFAKEDEDAQSPIFFEDLDGLYALYLVATDKLGNAMPAPLPGTKPQATLVLDTTKPQIQVQAPAGGAWLAGGVVDVLWTVRDNVDLPRNAITLSWSSDNGRTWTEIERGVSADAPYRWKAPEKAGDRYRIKISARDTAGNVAEVATDPFAIDEQIPTARVTGPTRSGRMTVNVEYDFQNRGYSKITKVTLYYSPDGGAHWYKHDVDADAQSPMTFSKSDGTYGLFAVAESEAGSRAGVTQKAPAEGTSPQVTIVIDATPPILTLESFSKGGVFAPGATQDILWTMREDHPDDQGLTILFSSDDGQTWARVDSGVDAAKGAYSWKLPGRASPRCRIKLVATDGFGNRGEISSAVHFTIGDTGASQSISLRGIEANQEVAAGTDVALSWVAGDESIREVELELSEADPDRWKSHGRYTTRSITFRTPLEHGRYAVRVRGIDAAKRSIVSNAISFVVGTISQIRISVDDEREPGEAVRVTILPSDLSRTTKSAKLQLFDGTWRDLADVTDSPASFVAPSREGEYAVRVVAKDKKDRELVSNEASFRVRKAERDPARPIVLESFTDGKVYRGGTTHLIAIKTQIRLGDLRVFLSSNSGRTWEEIPKASLIPAEGGLFWKTLPVTTGRNFRIKVQHEGVADASATDFSIDSTAPAARVSGPEGPVKDLPVKLAVRVTKSIADIKGIALYYTRDGGKSWRKYQDFADEKNVTFTTEVDGEHGFYATATSALNLSGAAPSPGTAPQHRIVLGKKVITDKGGVELLTKPARLVRGGTKMKIEWKGESTDPKSTVKIVAILDGATSVLKEDLPATGSWEWDIPLQDVNLAQIQVSINVGGKWQPSRWSGDFLIDGTPPKVTGADFED